MKRGTPRHKKMYALAEALKVPLPMAVGIMEMLWQFTADHCPQGDIGSIPDRYIAEGVGWTKRPALLINALCDEKSKWLDRDETHRLVVHDWPQHAEYEVCRKLIANKKDFLPCYGVSVRDRLTPSEKLRADARTESAQKRASREALAEAKALAKASDSEKGSEFAKNEPAHAGTNGNGMLPPDVGEEFPAYWAERMYARHPKKKNLPLVEVAVITIWQKAREPTAELRAIDAVHALWCETDDWKKNNGRYAPSLDRWLEDKGFTVKPDGEEEWWNGLNGKGVGKASRPA